MANVRAYFTLGLTVGCMTLAALAQEPQPTPQPGSELRPLQEKASLTDDDRAVIRRTVDRWVGDVGATANAVSQLRDESKGSNAYREAYAAAVIDSVNNGYKTAKNGTAAQLIAVLSVLNEAPAQKVLVEALADKRPPVRATAAVGLRNLHAKLAQLGGAYFTDTLSALKEAAKAETSTVALKAMFQALNFSEGGANSPDVKANAAAILEVIDDRATKQYATGKVKAEGADTVGLQALSALKAGLSDAERDRLTQAVARIISYAVTVYANELSGAKESLSSASAERRNAFELLIEECERQLADQLKPKTTPSVSKAMQTSEGSKKSTDMKTAMKEWARLLKEKYNQEFFTDTPAAEAAGNP